MKKLLGLLAGGVVALLIGLFLEAVLGKEIAALVLLVVFVIALYGLWRTR